MKIQTVFNQLKAKGYRLTNARKEFIKLLMRVKRPLSVPEISSLLIIKPNKTTLYREIKFLLKEGLIVELQLSSNKKSYEWRLNHHHHLICRQCDRIEEIDVKALEDSVDSTEKKLKNLTTFKQITHSLEFYGICPKH